MNNAARNATEEEKEKCCWSTGPEARSDAEIQKDFSAIYNR